MSFRFALQKYITTPEKFPDLVISYDDEFVLMKDAFPKSLYHWLLLPRDLKLSKQHPLTAFKDQELKERAYKHIDDAKKKILELLIKDHGIQETEDFVRAGCHAVPSMNNLHIHIISQDLCGERLKNRHHYNSFTTDFFVPFEDIPLSSGDKRLNEKEMGNKVSKDDMICLNCNRNFGNKFAELKRHLREEFKATYVSV